MNRSTSDARVALEVDDRGVASLRLDRAEANNAYDDLLLAALKEAVDKLRVHDSLRAVVLSGAGEHFQAGADLMWVDAVRRGGPRANLEASRLTAETLRSLATLPVPVVALVQGACIGGGTGIAASCDVVVAADDAYFSIAEARWGLRASIILPQLCRAMSSRQVSRYALTGERFSATQAQALGLVHEVVPIEQLVAHGEELVSAILLGGPAALRDTKVHIRWSSDPLESQGVADDLPGALVRAHAEGRQSDEAAEGLAAFHARRLPAWATGSAGIS